MTVTTMLPRGRNLRERDTERGKLSMPRQYTKRPATERFWEKVNKTDGCWLWTGAHHGAGYGSFNRGDGQYALAHRFAYEELVGPITAQTLDHLCRNRLCVNPKHLEPVSHSENIRRGAGAAYNREKSHCPQGHPYDLFNTVRFPSKPGSRECRACRAEAQRRNRAKG